MSFPSTHPPDGLVASRAYSKVMWRIVPILLAVYGLGFIDRVNVSYAQLAMHNQLGFTDAIYGLGAGLFSVGYLLFEIPSNLVLAKFGGRRSIAVIMAFWGFASAATALIATPFQFYIVRFTLGMFESGLFPGLVLYVSFWFPGLKRGWVFALLTIASLVANTVSGPVSGWILETMDGVSGIRNWQWLFILEALPSLIWGGVAYVMLVDRPIHAAWLSAAEKAVILDDLAEEERQKATGAASRQTLFRDPGIYVLGFGIFAVLCGYYAVTYWMPMIIRAAGVSNMLHVGLYAMIPNIFAVLAMLLNARFAGASSERRWHFSIPLFLAAIGLALTSIQGNLPLSLFALSIAFAGVMTALPIFWVMVTAYLPSSNAPVGIAFINSIGVIAGFASPYLVGYIKNSTGSMVGALVPMWLAMAAGAVVVPLCMPARRRPRATV